MNRFQHIFSSLVLMGLLLACANSAQAQLVVNNNPPNTQAQHLIENVLLGNGIQASNFSQYGHPTQLGVFQSLGATSPIGLDTGICMASGEVMDIPAFGNPSTAIGFTYGAGPWGGGDNDLTAVASSIIPGISQTRDACILEFDFIPTTDTVQFNYVFGSEEYLTWINTVYNDAFGFFISGPGITGPYSSPAGFPGGAQNVAVVPGTATPITITTVQPAANSQYYINNPSSTGVSYNGYSVPLTATLVVQPCQTYHIKLAIADGTDQILDSGVFLEGKSFSSTGVVVSGSPTFTTPTGGDSTIYEGCGEFLLTFTRLTGIADSLTLDITGSGTATNGVDFTLIPDSVTFAPGQQSISFTVEAFPDINGEPAEFYEFSLSDSSCTGSTSTGFRFYIEDPVPLVTQTEDDTVSCLTGPATIDVIATGGVPGYSYQWSNGATGTSQTVDPPVTTTFYVSVTDTCGLQTTVDSVIVYRFPTPVTTDLPDDTTDCTVDSLELTVQVLSGIAPFSYIWDTGDTTATIWVSPNSTTNFNVTITDACGLNQAVDWSHVTVVNEAIGVWVSEEEVECPGDQSYIDANPHGGTPPLEFWWGNGVANTGQWVTPDSSEYYPVYVTDLCAQDTIVAYAYVEVPQFSPLELRLSSDTIIKCPGNKATLAGKVIEGSGNYTVTWDTWANARQDDRWTISKFPQVTTTYHFKATDHCATDTVVGDVTVSVAEWPDVNVVMPEPFILCPGEGIEIQVQASGGTGVYEYEWDGFPMLNGDRFFAGPEENTLYTVTVTDECGRTDWGATPVYFLSPTARFDFNVVDNGYVQFENQSSDDAVAYTWDFGDGTQSQDENPLHQYVFDDGDQIVTLWAENEHGCRDSTQVLVEPPLMIFVPNSFTPDHDGLNDNFVVHGIGVADFEMWVFNRWGELLFHTDNMDNQWDGTFKGRLVPKGSYVYKIHAKSFDQRSLEKMGSLTVLVR